MSDESDTIEAVLDEHEPRWRGTGYGGGRMVCRCGDDCEDGYIVHAKEAISAALQATP